MTALTQAILAVKPGPQWDTRKLDARKLALRKLEAHRLEVRWASCEDDVRDAQRLRYRVFAQEMGAQLQVPPGTPAGLDVDRFDAFCDHLLVSAPGRGAAWGPLVGTYRVLPPAAARRAGGLYMAGEFDIAPLASLLGRTVEMGRSCVHPDWRSGGVIMALWTALAQYMLAHQLDTMMGCASVGLSDGGQCAERLWRSLRQSHLVGPQWQVQPRHALPIRPDDEPVQAARTDLSVNPCEPTPPLIKGYLRCGARLLGAPALDAAFNTADLPLMLHTHDLAPRYRKHFLGA